MVAEHLLLDKPYEIFKLINVVENVLLGKQISLEYQRGIHMDKKQILIVDDEMDTRLVLEKRLTAEGYSVVMAYNGNNALSIAMSKYPDLIILDRVLGDMLGEEVAAKLKKNPKTRDIPIIFLSALFSEKDEVEMGHVFDNEKMLAKPYDIKKLLTLIEELLLVSGRKSMGYKSPEGKRIMDTKISVLVIEDEEDVGKVLECRLKSDGFDVYSAADGPTGLKIADEKNPDVILLDWVMPKMSGLEVLCNLKQNERTRDIIVLMLTAKNMMDDVSTAFANGADDYIPKPFDGAELGQKIRSILRVIKEIKGNNAYESEEETILSYRAIDAFHRD
ncbi:MAG: response regulator [Phycisphaerae bacterium]|jgi:DNA-binding response OmpR family regulator